MIKESFSQKNNSEKCNRLDVRIFCSYFLGAKSTGDLKINNEIFCRSVECITKNICGKWKIEEIINPVSLNPRKWSSTLKQFVSKLPMNCWSVFVHFVGLVLKGWIHFRPVFLFCIPLENHWLYDAFRGLLMIGYSSGWICAQ